MQAIKDFFINFVSDEEGATAVEYAVMIVLIIVVCLVVIGFLGQNVQKGFKTVSDSLADKVPGGVK